MVSMFFAPRLCILGLCKSGHTDREAFLTVNLLDDE
jgi:hypothetical protein